MLLVTSMSIVTVYEQGKIVIPVELRKKYQIEKGMKLLVEEDPLHGLIILVPIPAEADPLEYFAVKEKLPVAEPKEVSGEEEARRNALRKNYT
jgi:bifunctional DNA-binding transcriptional regulator/antitoxin component of YhaV-PrlF toxin-antitoxin module